jgi:3-oxoacyl-[acyl-carrier protein] reductase
MIGAAVEAYGGLDIAVLNAGLGMNPTPLVDTADEFFDRVFRVNVRSVFLGAKHAVPALRARGGGSIIVTVSTAAMRPRPGLAVYNATKGALVPLCKALALEVAGDNIRVNGVCPVAGETAMLKDFIGDADPADARARFVATVPMGRLSLPADVAAAALFFADDESAFITGTMLEVDGGRCI